MDLFVWLGGLWQAGDYVGGQGGLVLAHLAFVTALDVCCYI